VLLLDYSWVSDWAKNPDLSNFENTYKNGLKQYHVQPEGGKESPYSELKRPDGLLGHIKEYVLGLVDEQWRKNCEPCKL